MRRVAPAQRPTGHPIAKDKKPERVLVEVTLPPLPRQVAIEVIRYANYLMADLKQELE